MTTKRTEPETARPDLEAVARALTELRLRAPGSVHGAVLRTLGLADGYDCAATPIGDVFVAWNGRGVSFIDRAPSETAFEAEARAVLGRPIAPAPLPPTLRRRLERRLAGDRRAHVPVDLRGRTAFEQAVLTTALDIPPGEVRPYAWLAARIGRPKAVRAVGSALARNPIPLVIPCHRVVRSDGTLGAYSMGGPATKRRLLAAEGAEPDALEALARAGIRFVGSRTTGIFCLPSCRNARRIAARHRIPLRSAEEGRAAGLRPCRVCRPVPLSAGPDAAGPRPAC